MASVGSIIGGAFGLVRDRPLSVLVWGVTYIVGMIVIGVAGAFTIAGMMGFDPAGRASGPPQLTGGFFVGMLFFYLAYFLLLTILMNAVFRSVLRPGDRSFASLRLGMDELRGFGLLILVLIVSVVLMFIVQLLMTMLTSFILLALQGGLLGSIAVTLLSLAYFCALIWVSVRLSLLYPLTFYRRAITIDGAWALTSGRFWTLFPAYLVVFLAFGAVFVALIWFTFGSLFVAMVQAGSDPAAADGAANAFIMQMAGIPWAVMALACLVWAALGTIAFSIFNAMAAVATRELLIESGETPEDEAYRAAEVFE